MDYLKLQNGSDIRGVALAGIEGEPVNLTEEAARAIARGFLIWLREKTGKKEARIAFGRDSRISGPDLLGWAAKESARYGADVTVFGLASTPAMFMSTVAGEAPFDGAVMVTASHLPWNRNGYKFFTKDGGLEKEDIKKILRAASDGVIPEKSGEGSLQETDFMETYAKILRDRIVEKTGSEKPLEGLRIVVDAGNGAGGFFVSKVLQPLGADTTGSQFLDPDGTFPNHIPNPENEAAMESVTSAVLKNKADLGIIFDTDVDRAGAVLPDGKELNRNRLIAMISAILLREQPGAWIVTDSITSTGLAEFIAAKGGVHHRFKRGYRNVINEMIRLRGEGHNALLAMETSGHGALAENYFLDDGAYLMVRLLIELANSRREGRTLEDLIKDLREPLEAKEFRFKILPEDFKSYGQTVLEDLRKEAETREGWSLVPNNYEGVRVNVGAGWFLLRLSLHDPILPLNVESDEKGGLRPIAEELLAFLGKYEELDLKPLRDYLS